MWARGQVSQVCRSVWLTGTSFLCVEGLAQGCARSKLASLSPGAVFLAIRRAGWPQPVYISLCRQDRSPATAIPAPELRLNRTNPACASILRISLVLLTTTAAGYCKASVTQAGYKCSGRFVNLSQLDPGILTWTWGACSGNRG
jgi:hypothetical protein